MFVLGIDAGGTKTVCYLADEAEKVVAEGRGAGANLKAAGERGIETILRRVIDEARGRASGELEAVCLGMAGVDRPQEASLVRRVLERLVVTRHLVVVNDALVALEAGAPAQAAIVVISGTGSIAYGRDARGRAARSGGWGYVLADEGSGYWLGRQALRAVMREADGRAPATSLTRRLLAHYHVSHAPDLGRAVYAGDLQPAAIAKLAAEVQDAADEGDGVAGQIIEQGAVELAAAVLSVARRLELTDCRVLLAGGIFRTVARMCEAVTAELTRHLPRLQVHRLEVEPAVGAVRLALGAARNELVLPEYIDLR
jgi:N-acetylglucosamine kinase-like BadF-type ATPase